MSDIITDVNRFFSDTDTINSIYNLLDIGKPLETYNTYINVLKIPFVLPIGLNKWQLIGQLMKKITNELNWSIITTKRTMAIAVDIEHFGLDIHRIHIQPREFDIFDEKPYTHTCYIEYFLGPIDD